uniref:Uncharacterized protein n=1 Tax=Anguilla anguilla TaxID=7936 RepID=A0A0E9R6B2_ANGAN
MQTPFCIADTPTDSALSAFYPEQIDKNTHGNSNREGEDIFAHTFTQTVVYPQ